MPLGIRRFNRELVSVIGEGNRNNQIRNESDNIEGEFLWKQESDDGRDGISEEQYHSKAHPLPKVEIAESPNKEVQKSRKFPFLPHRAKAMFSDKITMSSQLTARKTRRNRTVSHQVSRT